MKNKGTILTVILVLGLGIIFFSVSRDRDGKDRPKAVIGLNAPGLSLKDASGNALNPGELKDTVVFINFWASWCQPCRDEMPSIQGLYDHFKENKKFRVITVLYNDAYESAARYLKENNLDLPVLIDGGGKSAKAYGITGVPETYIIDKKGILIKKFTGPAEWNSPKIVSALTSMINQ